MNGFVIFNNQRSRDVGLRISGFSTFNAPQRVYESVKVPGKNGVLHIDTGTFENLLISYEASLVHDFARNSAALREWLLSPVGYCRLEDSYHPDIYRLARYSGGISFTDFTQLCRAAKVKLSFDCKPQRFLKLGEIPLENPAAVRNPTAFPAKPIVQFAMTDASGSVTIGDCTIEINGATTGNVIIIDAETLDAIGPNSENRNDMVSIRNELVLAGGAVTSMMSEGIENLTIIPRWWTI